MKNNEDRFSDIKQYTDYLKNVSITPYNFKEHFDEIMAFNTNYSSQLKELLRKEEQAISAEEKINESLKRQGKNINDAQLSLQNANDISNIRKQHIDCLLDFRNISLVLIDMFFAGIIQVKNALDLAKGAELAKEMASEQKKLFSDIFERVDGLRVRDLARAEEMNQRILELHEHSLGQLVAKLDITQLAKSCDIVELNKLRDEYRRKEDEYDSKIQEISRKERDIIDEIRVLKEDYEKKIKQDTKNQEDIKKKYESRIKDLNKDILLLQSKEKILNSKSIGVAASSEVIEQVVPTKENEVYDEVYWKNRLRKKYHILLALYQNNKDVIKTADFLKLSKGRIYQVNSYLIKNNLQHKFEEHLETLDLKPIEKVPTVNLEDKEEEE